MSPNSENSLCREKSRHRGVCKKFEVVIIISDMRDGSKVFAFQTETLRVHPSTRPIFRLQISNSISTNMRPGAEFMFDSIMELRTGGFGQKAKLRYQGPHPSRASDDMSEYIPDFNIKGSPLLVHTLSGTLTLATCETFGTNLSISYRL